MNRTIFQGIKKNLLKSGAKWYEELPRVLWSYKTTPSNAADETPFRKPKKQDKLNPKWEGPYKIRRVIGPGTYELEELSGKSIKHIWHGIYLKRYYT
ncbi:hypothetical protein LIER_03991 [Lithospermum erythrorhizon]|uniref:Uncharacterized protein n=1 Tax=Lithospermum erythrorhizon TaxID=34254 RepID=A0AAV3NVV4_LITER